MSSAEDGDRLLAEGNAELAQQCFANAAYFEELAMKGTQEPVTRAVLARSAATLALQAGWPDHAEGIVHLALSEGVELDELRAELREVLRAAWAAQGISAKSDRATSDTYTMQRRSIRSALKRMKRSAP